MANAKPASRYTALIDGEEGAYGVAFPDLPGCVAQAATLEAAMRNAGEALREFVADALDHGEIVPAPRSLEELRQDPEIHAALMEGATLASIALVRHTGKTVKANLPLDVCSPPSTPKRQNATSPARPSSS